MAERTSKPRNISLYQKDWEDIEQVAEQSGVKSISAAVRIILQEWRASRLVIRKADEVDCVTGAN